jgi:hypothetical protein
MESSPKVTNRRDAQDGTPEAETAPCGAPASLVEEVSALWAAHFGDREVGPEDDFFVLGGNSLTGIKIIERVAQDYGIQLSVRDFYLAQTPTRVAELIEQGRTRT